MTAPIYDLKTAVTILAICFGLYASGYAMGVNTLVDELEGQVDMLQDTVIDQDERIASLTTSLDYQEATDDKQVLIAKYIRSRNSQIGDSYAALLASTLVAAGDEFNFDPLFLAAQAGVESAFNTHDSFV